MNRIGAAVIGALAASAVLAGCSLGGDPIVQPTAAELAVLDGTVRDLQWQGLGFSPDSPRPAVEFESYVDPDDTTDVYGDCMEEAGHEGWDATTFYSRGDQPVVERLDLYACLSRFPLHPSFYHLYSPGQLDAIYDYYQDELVPCMSASGISVRGIPSRDDFVETPAAFGSMWNPYNYDYELTERERTALFSTCTDITWMIGRPAS